MPPLLPSSGKIDIATIQSYLGISGKKTLNDHDLRRIRGDKTGIPVSQNPFSMNDLHGANVQPESHYTGAPGYIAGYLAPQISPYWTDLNTITSPGTYGVGDGSGWRAEMNGPTAAHNYGQLYVKIEANTTTITQIYYKAYAQNDHWIRYRNPSGTWCAWEHFVF